MPSSDPAAREAVIHHVVANGVPGRILDIGMGAGHYGKLFKEARPDVELFGIEIFNRSFVVHAAKILYLRTHEYVHVAAHVGFFIGYCYFAVLLPQVFPFTGISSAQRTGIFF